ncbi:hypothetical protein [Amycolatopsis sp. cmx-11-12]
MTTANCGKVTAPREGFSSPGQKFEACTMHGANRRTPIVRGG